MFYANFCLQIALLKDSLFIKRYMQKRRPGQQSVTQKHRVKQCHVCSNFFLGEHDLKQHEDGIQVVAYNVTTDPVVPDPAICTDGGVAEGVKDEVDEDKSKADTTCGVCNLQNDKLEMIKVTPILWARVSKTLRSPAIEWKLLENVPPPYAKSHILINFTDIYLF